MKKQETYDYICSLNDPKRLKDMEWLLDLGYFGLFIGTFLAGTVLPFSSDILMVGLLAAGGNPWLCLTVATLGNWAGTILNYLLGWLAKWDWLEKMCKVKEETLVKQKKNIDKYGLLLAFFSWLPIIGAVGVIALGFYKVKPIWSNVMTLLGCFVRFFFWIFLQDIFF